MRLFLMLSAPAALLSAALVTTPPATAQDACTSEQIFAVVDETGARLRQIDGEARPAMVAKLKTIGARRGWADADLELEGRRLLDDEETRRLDSQAGQLLDQLGRLGDDEQSKAPACERLQAARTTSAQLIEVTRTRAAHVSARLAAAASASPATSPPTPPKSAAATPTPPIRRPATAPAAKPPNPASWSANTTVTDARPAPPPPPPQVMTSLPRPLEPGELGFSPEDIRAAGRGFFGTISAGLASVIDYAFTTYGKPTGYILGTEGGGAFLAGLRYGDGRLVTKLGGERRIYWQGPSVGYDVGLTGSRVMVLVYNLNDHQQMFTRFLGVDGSAYLVGGVGITFLKKGPLVLAPIRTGLGLRLGANVGYLKFTPQPSLNPF